MGRVQPSHLNGMTPRDAIIIRPTIIDGAIHRLVRRIPAKETAFICKRMTGTLERKFR
jgi:hypothetical protein